MEKDKKTLIISTVAIILLIIIVIGATYAYFKAQTGSGANVPTQVTTNTTDSFILETGSDISITADMGTFAEGMDNRTGTTFARATMRANNKTNSYSGNYYVYFDVKKNELNYTTDAKKPELLLKVTKKIGSADAAEVTTGIEGLEYKTVTDGKGNQVSGYDITEYTGLLTIVNNKEITTTSETIEKYDIEVILVNLDEDQTANGGKSFVGSLKIQKEKIVFPLLADYVKGLYTGTQGENNIYYHKNLENSAEDESYRYTGASYKLTSKAYSFNNIYDTSADANGIIKMYCDGPKWASYVGLRAYCSNYYYYLAYDADKIQYNSCNNAFKQALSDGYIEYNMNNYLCFGTYAGTCDNDHLYRIIGVFGNQVKLIKADFATAAQLGATEKAIDYHASNYANYKGQLTEIPKYYWSGSTSNQVNSWASSTLNTNALNTNFLGTFNETWQRKIATTNWKIGGNTETNIKYSNAPAVYKNEIINPVIDQATVNNKIGLMYVSDYMYGASSNYWMKLGSTDSNNPDANGNHGAEYDYRAAIDSNWMYSGGDEWTISRCSDVTVRAFYVEYDGVIFNNPVTINNGLRPVFYLESTVTMTGGNGTPENPYRVN